MIRQVHTRFLKSALFIGLMMFPLIALAASEKRNEPVGKMSAGFGSVDWQVGVDNDHLQLVVAGPNGFSFTKDFPSGKAPQFRVQDNPAKNSDGSYTYELRLIPRISADIRKQLATARAANDDAAIRKILTDNGLLNPVVQSGAFTILNGAVVSPDLEEPGSSTGSAPSASSVASPSASATPSRTHAGSIHAQDVVVADDQIVQGSLCVGLDCVNNESFGFDTIRLKENNTRIKYEDTSTSAGFPTHDWQLTANDSASGGLEKFSIEDITASTVPFTVAGSAPTNSVFVANTGKVGFRNSSPVLDLHMTTGDTPAWRLEQTNASGFTAQTWDVAGNEANWFVRDVTGGSRLPLRIRPGAPTSSVDIAASGKVGVATASPDASLHVFCTATTDCNIGLGSVGATGTGPTMFIGYSGASLGRGATFINSRTDASATAPNPSFRIFTADTQRFIIDNEGFLGLGTVSNPAFPIEHSNGARLTTGGVWTDASSRALKQDIHGLDTDAARAALENLEPVTYAYKADPNEHHVGFIAEDVPQLVASTDRKALSPMDIVAVLTSVVKDQQKTIDELKARLDQIEKK